jgi:hypothetical protein
MVIHRLLLEGIDTEVLVDHGTAGEERHSSTPIFLKLLKQTQIIIWMTFKKNFYNIMSKREMNKRLASFNNASTINETEGEGGDGHRSITTTSKNNNATTSTTTTIILIADN